MRKQGNYYTRDDEIHHVRLYETSEIIDQLSQIGLQVETMENYGEFQLAPSQTVFVTCKKI